MQEIIATSLSFLFHSPSIPPRLASPRLAFSSSACSIILKNRRSAGSRPGRLIDAAQDRLSKVASKRTLPRATDVNFGEGVGAEELAGRGWRLSETRRVTGMDGGGKGRRQMSEPSSRFSASRVPSAGNPIGQGSGAGGSLRGYTYSVPAGGIIDRCRDTPAKGGRVPEDLAETPPSRRRLETMRGEAGVKEVPKSDVIELGMIDPRNVRTIVR